MSEIPVLRGYVKKKQIFVFCPYCDCWHIHGYTEEMSHRTAHCTGTTPLRETGYYVSRFKKPDVSKLLNNYYRY